MKLFQNWFWRRWSGSVPRLRNSEFQSSHQPPIHHPHHRRDHCRDIFQAQNIEKKNICGTKLVKWIAGSLTEDNRVKTDQSQTWSKNGWIHLEVENRPGFHLDCNKKV